MRQTFQDFQDSSVRLITSICLQTHLPNFPLDKLYCSLNFQINIGLVYVNDNVYIVEKLKSRIIKLISPQNV